MKFIIPIENLLVEGFINLENICFLPPYLYDEQQLPFNVGDIGNEIIEQTYDILNNCAYEYKENYQKYSIAIVEYPFTEEEFDNNVPIQDFYTLEKACYKVDRALDQIRLSKCNFLNKEILPGIAGIIGKYQRGIVVDMVNNYSREVLGKVYGIYSLPGIGLEIDTYDIEYDEVNRKLFDTDRIDSVFLKCRNAITRINEAYYFNNLNTSFVYLMSTLEMLASDNYMQFKKVKTNIVAFIATSKSDYHKKCEKLRGISEDIRTEIIHNGKSLYDVMDNNSEINKLLGFLVDTIVKYCESVVSLEIHDENELVKERDRRILQFSN
ncbi:MULTISPECIES: hypothetical protein [unclassified Clostridium]|uniref:hypothetical protein n=1 Tax=unclassified Clostridium TaxID=2614128 RepID=UPI0013F0CCD2|nr:MULTISPECIES: hypothetical protein [unclassified Clostridium]NFI19527.1 hypothetical protein [Clostridium botulinum]NFL94070.1 hypothetical protein [Clostridium botulinum]NFO27025.1 hypothetical protein [Clostridium botulinum]NFO61549.1 hypothetical protein [Clostridium botulinum]